MYAIKSFLALLAFFALVIALVDGMPVPDHHRRLRRACSKSSHATSSATETSTAKAESTSSASSSGKNQLAAKPSSSASSAEPKASGNATSTPSPKIGTGLMAALMPVDVKSGNEGWSTASEAVDALPLSDATFKPTKLISSLSHSYVAAPDGKKSMKAHYPKGSYTYTHSPQGGLSFYAPGPENVDLTTAKEATLGYSVMFDKDWDWNKGGKLPGLYGGDSDEIATSCSGGRRSEQCWSARFMWRTEGKGELYTYLPSSGEFASPNKKLCSVAPQSECNPTYGASVGRGAFNFKAGEWNQISQRVRLNDPGQANGELEVFFNGKSVINVSGVMLRKGDEGKFRGIQMQTFFGGSDSSFASPQDQDAYFSDFSVAITEKL